MSYPSLVLDPSTNFRADLHDLSVICHDERPLKLIHDVFFAQLMTKENQGRHRLRMRAYLSVISIVSSSYLT